LNKKLFFKTFTFLLCTAHLIVCGQKQESAYLSQQIRKLKFEGNQEFTDKELSEAISFTANKWLGQKIFGKEPSFYSKNAYLMNIRELKHFYQSEGFLNIEIKKPLIKTKRRESKIDLTIVLNENQAITIDSVIFKGSADLLNEELKHLIYKDNNKLKALPGNRFRDEIIWSDRDEITSFLVDKGYAYAETAPSVKTDTINKTTDIIWETNVGPLSYFGKTSISGQKRTPEKLILRQLAFKEGDPYSRQKLNLSQQQIYQLGTFRIASMKAQLSRDKNDTIPINISITESPATSTRMGVGYGREDKFRTFVSFQVLNFPGGAIKLNLYAKHSAIEPYRFEAKLTQPAAFSPNSSLILSPAIKKQKESGYELFSYSATLTLLQRITDKLTSSFSLYYENVNLDTTSVATTYDDSSLLENYSKGGITLGAVYDNTSPRFNPSKGFTVAFNAKSNSMLLLRKYPFIKYQIEAKNYELMGEGFILASRIKLGTIYTKTNSDQIIPVEERFFSGGSRSIRGWSRQQLGPKDNDDTPIGGNSIFEASIESRISIYGPLSIVLFMDAGNVWLKAEEISLKQIHLAAGSGLRFDTPIGPVGIDTARPVWDNDSKWQIHFNIGHAF